MNRRQRLERKVEKRREWAEKRRDRSQAGFARAKSIADNIPFGQPILVGHHSEKGHRRDIARIDSGMREGCESAKMANHHESKADGIEAQLDTSIFSDDDNAIEAIEARIREREAERDRIKAYNASCRAAAKRGESGDLSLLDERQRRDIAGIARVCRYQVREGGAFPAYVLSNLGGRIKADRDRLEQIKRREARQAKAEADGGLSIVGDDYINVTFAEKPERSILDALKAAGFHWSGGTWCGYRANLPAAVVAMVPA